mmetsp:Transcript_40760/g.121596  ORF Transcript_40760/g.121596 Transcript_40760/m.121596 type:complete len:89 (-) Transcript_40760:177-443(-)
MISSCSIMNQNYSKYSQNWQKLYTHRVFFVCMCCMHSVLHAQLCVACRRVQYWLPCQHAMQKTWRRAIMRIMEGATYRITVDARTGSC